MSRGQALPSAASNRHLLVDGHVHFHHGFSASTFLAAAWLNLRHAAERRGFGHLWEGALLLTAGPGEHGFERLAREAPEAGWNVVERGDHAYELIADSRRGRQRLTLVAGRQIITREEIEVLGFGPIEKVAIGTPLEHTLLQLQEKGGLAVLPWGFGKWWGRRGRRVERLLRFPPKGLDSDRLLVGDNGGRPRWSRTPELLRLGYSLGYRILSGSDPLPFHGQQWRVGSYGSYLELDQPESLRTLSSSRHIDPVPWLIDQLAAPSARLRPFGRRRAVLGFVLDQLRMQWRKRVLQPAVSGNES